MKRDAEGITRRDMVKVTALGGTGLVLLGRISKAREPGEAEPVFEERQRVVLASACETILPGAIDAGVMEYIEYWLKKEPFASARKYLKVGAIQLDTVSRRKFKKGFVSLSASDRQHVLKSFQKGEIKVKRFDGKTFYKQLVEFVLEGFLSDPKYGGNKNRVGWKFIGMPDGYRSCWWNPHGVRRVLSPDKGFHD